MTASSFIEPRDHSCAILIPALNEEASVGTVVRRILDYHCGEVVVIADACTDGTERAARAAGATVLSLPLRLGAWGAIQTGIRYALAHGHDCAITMDADGQHNPTDIRRLLDPLSYDQADVSLGACIQRGSRARRIAWHYLRGISALRLQDITSGYRAYNRRAMALLAQPQATLLDYQDIGVLLMLLENNLRIAEVPVEMDMRVNGRSRIFHSWSAVTYYMYHTSVLAISKLLKRGAPDAVLDSD